MSAPSASSLPGALASWASLEKALKVTLKKVIGKKARGISNGCALSFGICFQARALTHVPSLSHSTAVSQPCPHLAADPNKPNPNLKTDFMT